jgi:hypothetical protein
MVPARRTATKIKQDFIWLLGNVSKPNYVVKVTKKDGTIDTITNYIISPINYTWNSLLYEADSCNITLDNSNGRFVDLTNESLNPIYIGGETITIDFDYGSGTTRVFKGKLHSLKFNRNKIRSCTLFARKLPKLLDRKIRGYYNGNPKTLVKNIIDTYFSDIISYTNFEINAPTSQTIEITYSDYAFRVIQEIFELCVWDGYFDSDASDTGKIDIDGFSKGTKNNLTFALIDGVNILNLSNFGFDTLDEFNNIQAQGNSTAGEQIIYTVQDSTSISNLWQRDLDVNDSKIESIEQAKIKADAELSNNSGLGKKGSITSIASKDIIPCKKIKVSSQYDGVFGDFIPAKISYTLWKTATMSVELDREQKGITEIIFDRIKSEENLRPAGNNNDMLFSLNLPFDDDSYVVSLGDAEILNGQLSVKSTFDSSISTFRYPNELPVSVSQFEVVCEDETDFATATIRVALDGNNYTTATTHKQLTTATAGDYPIIEIRLNSATAVMKGIVVRFK